jgi:hypothetical protein
MKIILLIGIFSQFFVNSIAEKTITCEVLPIFTQNGPICHFAEVTLGPNEAVTIELDRGIYGDDESTIYEAVFPRSSIYSVPREIFAKFPNLKVFWAYAQNIREIKPDTFREGKQLEKIGLRYNLLTFLHKDTFKGEYF